MAPAAVTVDHGVVFDEYSELDLSPGCRDSSDREPVRVKTKGQSTYTQPSVSRNSVTGVDMQEQIDAFEELFKVDYP